jgi:hypothetical protein
VAVENFSMIVRVGVRVGKEGRTYEVVLGEGTAVESWLTISVRVKVGRDTCVGED